MFSPIHDDLESNLDTKFVLSDFQGQSISDLAILIQNGNNDAKEELFMRFDPFMMEMAMALSVKYRQLDDDKSLYFEFIYHSIDLAIQNYSPAKGDFFHFWRTIMKWEKRKTLTYLAKNKRPNKQNTIYEGSFNSDDFYDFFDKSEELVNSELFNSIYDKESCEKILAFISHHYGEKERCLLGMWMNFYPLKEISKKVKLPLRVVVSKIYSLLDAVRDAIGKGYLKITK